MIFRKDMVVALEAEDGECVQMMEWEENKVPCILRGHHPTTDLIATDLTATDLMVIDLTIDLIIVLTIDLTATDITIVLTIVVGGTVGMSQMRGIIIMTTSRPKYMYIQHIKLPSQQSHHDPFIRIL